MAVQLLNLPPEILLQILSKLSIKPLLRFAQTSQYARKLAYTDLQALSLAVCPSHQDSWHNKLFAARRKPEHDLHASVQIPRACDFSYTTLLTFHNKIIGSILDRHAQTLQRLELALWTLSAPVAESIKNLSALRELSIRIESVHTVPRAYLCVQKTEECKAWTVLASTANSIHALRIENAEINASQLLDIVGGAAQLRDLSLSGCSMLTSSIWDATELTKLHKLSILRCPNIHVSDTAVQTISKMHRLQVRPLHGFFCSCRARVISAAASHTISGTVANLACATTGTQFAWLQRTGRRGPGTVEQGRVACVCVRGTVPAWRCERERCH